MEALDIAAFGSFVALALAWVILPLRAPAATPRTRTFSEVAEAYQSSRVDVAPATARSIGATLRAIATVLGDRDPQTLTPDDVQAWISGSSLKPSSARQYLATLRQVLDYAGLDPNPARDRRVRLPRSERTLVDPPSAAEVETIIANVPERFRLPLRLLEATGMRVGELAVLAWGDVDEQGSRLRVKQGKSAAARRWVSVPDWLMVEVAAVCPREDRTPERRVFGGVTPSALKAAMARACRLAGISHYHPHDLRHRRISLWVKQGVPITEIAAAVGHSRTSLTLDTYSHVLLDERG